MPPKAEITVGADGRCVLTLRNVQVTVSAGPTGADVSVEFPPEALAAVDRWRDAIEAAFWTAKTQQEATP